MKLMHELNSNFNQKKNEEEEEAALFRQNNVIQCHFTLGF